MNSTIQKLKGLKADQAKVFSINIGKQEFGGSSTKISFSNVKDAMSAFQLLSQLNIVQESNNSIHSWTFDDKNGDSIIDDHINFRTLKSTGLNLSTDILEGIYENEDVRDKARASKIKELDKELREHNKVTKKKKK